MNHLKSLDKEVLVSLSLDSTVVPKWQLSVFYHLQRRGRARLEWEVVFLMEYILDRSKQDP